VVWGTVLLAEAVVRVPLVYLLPINIMVGLSTALLVVTIGRLERPVRRAGPAPGAEKVSGTTLRAENATSCNDHLIAVDVVRGVVRFVRGR
jgi:hypothetical protein